MVRPTPREDGDGTDSADTGGLRFAVLLDGDLEHEETSLVGEIASHVPESSEHGCAETWWWEVLVHGSGGLDGYVSIPMSSRPERGASQSYETTELPSLIQFGMGNGAWLMVPSASSVTVVEWEGRREVVLGEAVWCTGEQQCSTGTHTVTAILEATDGSAWPASIRECEQATESVPWSDSGFLCGYSDGDCEY